MAYANEIEHKKSQESEIKPEIAVHNDSGIQPAYDHDDEKKVDVSKSISSEKLSEKKDRREKLLYALHSIDGLISSDNKILNSKGLKIKDSNINEIVNFLLNPNIRSYPTATVRVLKVIKDTNREISRLIDNKKAKRALSKITWKDLQMKY